MVSLTDWIFFNWFIFQTTKFLINFSLFISFRKIDDENSDLLLRRWAKFLFEKFNNTSLGGSNQTKPYRLPIKNWIFSSHNFKFYEASKALIIWCKRGNFQTKKRENDLKNPRISISIRFIFYKKQKLISIFDKSSKDVSSLTLIWRRRKKRMNIAYEEKKSSSISLTCYFNSIWLKITLFPCLPKTKAHHGKAITGVGSNDIACT